MSKTRKRHVHADSIIAWANGSRIQALLKGKWVNVENPSWHEDVEYRIAGVEQSAQDFVKRAKTAREAIDIEACRRIIAQASEAPENANSRPCMACENCVCTYPHSDIWAHSKGQPTTGCLECDVGESMNSKSKCPLYTKRAKGKKLKVIYR